MSAKVIQQKLSLSLFIPAVKEYSHYARNNYGA